MKAIILAGGFGTRLAEETHTKPKPMVEVGGRPLLWHIMKHLSQHGIDEFIITLGYRGEVIKRYFLEYRNLNGNLTIDFDNENTHVLRREMDNWRVHLQDTGAYSLTAGRIKKVAPLIGNEPFLVTYGDGLSDVAVDKVIAAHRDSHRIGTVTAVRPPARFGTLDIEENQVTTFREKPHSEQGWINGGFLVFNPEVFDLISSPETSLEATVLQQLASQNQLSAYCHQGFWQCVDTMRELKYVEELWNTGQAPWKTWEG